jgi:hypothetical protein
MSDSGTALAEARSAYAERRWPDAYAALTAADGSVPLTADHLAALADCAWWLGRVDESIAAGELVRRPNASYPPASCSASCHTPRRPRSAAASWASAGTSRPDDLARHGSA